MASDSRNSVLGPPLPLPFSVMVVSQGFSGKSRIERHRMINGALAAELAGPVHALAITALTPEERTSQS